MKHVLIGYYLPQFLEDLEKDVNTIYASVRQNRKVTYAQKLRDILGDKYISVESKDGCCRKLYVVAKSCATMDSGARKFFNMSEAIKWLVGTNNAIEYNDFAFDVHAPSNRYHEFKNMWSNPYKKQTIIPLVKRIEQNIKNQALYTTVIWADGSKPTVVKCAKDDPDDLYFAVASAIAIKMHGSNSAFKRMIHEKYGGLK